MKKIILIFLTYSTVLVSCGDKENAKMESDSLKENESSIELVNLIGHTYAFNYADYIYHIKIESDSTVFWKLIEGDYEGPSEETDKYIHSKINDKIHFISWTEESGLELFNVLDFENNKLTTHGKLDGYMFVNPGTLKLVE